MRRILSVTAVLAIIGLPACSARQAGGVALITSINNRPSPAQPTRVAGSAQPSRPEPHGTPAADRRHTARTARNLPLNEHRTLVAGTSGRSEPPSSAADAPVGASSERPVSDSSTEKPVDETQLRQNPRQPRASLLRPVGIVLLIVTLLVVTRRLL